MRILLTSASVLWLCTSLMGCGSDDGDDNLGGVDGNKELSEITTSEYEAMCEDLRSKMVDELTVERLCTVLGAAYTDTESACNGVKEECMDDPPPQFEEIQDQIAGEDDCFEGDYSTCSATVAQASSCANEIVGRLGAWIGNVSCAQADEIDEDYFDDNPFGDTPAQCEPIAECGLLGD